VEYNNYKIKLKMFFFVTKLHVLTVEYPEQPDKCVSACYTAWEHET